MDMCWCVHSHFQICHFKTIVDLWCAGEISGLYEVVLLLRFETVAAEPHFSDFWLYRPEMLEQLFIFTRGGLILWTCQELGNALKGSPIDILIRSCLLEERSGSTYYNYDVPGAAYTLKWTFHNELGLVFVAVYQRILHLLYVDDLLTMVKKEFSKIYDPKRTLYNDFDDIFQQLRKEAEARVEEMKKTKQAGKPMKNSLVKKQGQVQRGMFDGGNKKSESGDDGGEEDKVANRSLENGDSNCRFENEELPAKGTDKVKEDVSSKTGAFDVNKLQKLRSKGGKKTDTVVKKGSKTEPKKIMKKNRVWDDSHSQAKLDFTDHVNEDEVQNVAAVAVDQGESMMDKEEIINDSESEEDEEETYEDRKVDTKKKWWFSSMFQSVRMHISVTGLGRIHFETVDTDIIFDLPYPFSSIAGKANLEKADLELPLKALKDMLMTKNVAEEIAEKLCESVAANLEGKKQASFTRISSIVKAAMEEALVRILTPKHSIDILRDVHTAKEQGKPYVVVFVGVNGVGKSTNLAKVAYWLLQHKINVMMAACDTFRSGAVEQLRTHARRLQIPIFEKGYEKDPAIVAKEAIEEASRNGSDVVLVDTAG
nr:signal recognition particle receptor subunit alpha-like [Ipomoea batatas]